MVGKKKGFHEGLTIDGEGKFIRLYRIFTGMKSRCYNPNEPAFKYYGGKGVTIHEEWLRDFASFKEWAENNGYDDSLSIDRIDGTKGYSPDNCRWATPLEQTRNRTSTWFVTIDGVKKTAAEWCEIYGVKHTTARERKRQGWDEVDAVSITARRRRDFD